MHPVFPPVAGIARYPRMVPEPCGEGYSWYPTLMRESSFATWLASA